jgi:hypothetical protein
MELVSVVPPFMSAWPSADEGDLPIWTAAVLSGAGFVVSHNVRDFPPRDADGVCAYRGIEFITTENFVVEVLSLDLDAVAPIPVPPTGRLVHPRRL